MDNERSEFVATIVEAANQIATVLDENPIRGARSYALAEVHRELAECHGSMWNAVREYQDSIAIDAEGRKDKFGCDLAAMMGNVQYVLVFYHNLADVPDHMRAQLNREISAIHLLARRVRDRKRR